MGVPERFAGYEILREIGHGAMGAVYLVERDGWRFALKVIRGAEDDPEAAERFAREARVLRQLDHPNVVQLIDAGLEGEVPYIVLEYVEGRSLEEHVAAGGPLEVDQALAILRDLARGVDHAHGQGVLHRDIKPANVILTEWGIPKLADFGLAKLLSGRRSDLTRSGDVLGTPVYMSPEQALGHLSELGPAADVYSLGATLYFLLTGRPPFLGKSIPEVLGQVVDDPPPLPSQLRSGLAPALDALVVRCLAKAPGDRPGSALELAEALEGCAVVPRVADPAKRRGGIPLAIAVAAGVLLAGGLGEWLGSASAPPEPEAPSESLPGGGALLLQAEAAEQAGEPLRVVALCEEALRLEPDNARAWHKLSIAQLHLGRLDEARAACDRAVELGPREVEHWSMRATVRHRQGSFAGAVSDGDQAIALDPTHTSALINRGAAYFAQGNYGLALADYQRALALEPENTEVLNNLAVVQEAREEWQGAYEVWTRLLEVGGPQAEAYFQRAAVLSRMGRLPEASVDLVSASEADPKRVDVWAALGQVRQARGDGEGAFEAFTKGLLVAPDAVELLVLRAALGRETARADLERALWLAPDHPQAARWRAAVRRMR